uniref:Uncharacterized protein n=1 Tax=Lepeophtheirus salmonis TaxID=72036 RepID=A0A0K2U6W1_LEPSM
MLCSVISMFKEKNILEVLPQKNFPNLNLIEIFKKYKYYETSYIHFNS